MAVLVVMPTNGMKAKALKKTLNSILNGLEVRHILPLHKGGFNVLDSLLAVCVHRHKMLHFADAKQKSR